MFRFKVVLFLVFSFAGHYVLGGDDFVPLHQHLQQGRYEEALELCDALAEKKENKTNVAKGKIVKSRYLAMVATGQYNTAREMLDLVLKTDPKNADIYAYSAELFYKTGQYKKGEAAANFAIQQNAEHPLAHLVLADIYTETGRLKKGHDGYRWFVRYYNRVQPKDANSLLLTGRGSAQYARWNSASQIFDFVVNTLCVDALAADELSWQAYSLSGKLLLEKFNRAQSIPDFKKGLAINPQATDLWVSLGEADAQKYRWAEAEKLADKALKINPQHLGAFHLKMNVQLAAGHIEKTLQLAQRALKINPQHQTTLSYLAACYYLQEGAPDKKQLQTVLKNFESIDKVHLKKPSRLLKLLTALAKQNSHPGYFFDQLGTLLELKMKFTAAEQFYNQAIIAMPKLPSPKTSLGMLYMRVGKTKEATKMLNDAFRADPYHVRVSNMRKVLRVLKGYDVIATEHFVVRVDSKYDRLLGEYMSDYLEEIHPELIKQFGYEPLQRTQFEIFNKSKGVSAHGWFSARMVGLPWIQTIGASTGMIVALASPTASPKPYNWARVLKHEYVHIITLQQTNFNIPHWFTEALAVTSEGTPRPDKWNELLLQRVPQEKLWTLSNLNDGFTRPESPDDWQFAYCQSRLYAQYMIEKHGKEVIPKLLELYRKGKPTAEAVPQATGVSLEQFEKGYLKYLKKITATLQGRKNVAETKSLKELQQAHADKPNDLKISARLAFSLYKNNKLSKARKLAKKILKKDSTLPRAALVIALLELKSADNEAAIDVLTPALNKENPHPQLLTLLAKTELAEEHFKKATTLYELGEKNFPHNLEWTKGLATLYLQTKNESKLKTVLTKLAEHDSDNPLYRKKLAKMSLENKEYTAAIKHARMALHVDVLDAEIHHVLGVAYRENKQPKRARKELKIALELKPKDKEIEKDLSTIQASK